MKKIVIIGAGPTGIYTFFSLLQSKTPLSILICEREKKAGVGMPYKDEKNSELMLANIASIEIPPLISTYLEWLKNQDKKRLMRYSIDQSTLHDHQFLPRILLGKYFRDQFLVLVKLAKDRGFEVAVRECCEITDLEATCKGVKLWAAGKPIDGFFDMAVITTGHVWPEEEGAMPTYFPSPWSRLLKAKIPDCKVGIMGSSLSAIDAAMLVAAQHGNFIEIKPDRRLRFVPDYAGKKLSITLMSRSGILPEADFYCPIPYAPLAIATSQAIKKEIAEGQNGLLDRVFTLMVRELTKADPAWSKRIALDMLDADSFAPAYFAKRKWYDPFRWARCNLREVEQNKRYKRTVAWRYTILRLHQIVETIVPYLNDMDRKRFDTGLGKVFIDNYSAVPSESIRRLLALREAGIINILKLGNDYCMDVKEDHTLVNVGGKAHVFEIFIDARGQKPLKIQDLPFPRLRNQLQAVSENISDISTNYILMQPESVRRRIAFGALPYLLHDHPFVQGITVSADIGAAIAKAIMQQV